MRMLRQLGLLSLAIGLTVAACDDDDPVEPAAEVYTATMSGPQETPPVQTNATATGTFTVTGDDIAYNITIQNWPANNTVFGAHIHRAPVAPATTGAVMVTFPITGQGAITTTGGSGTVENVPADQLAAIRAGGTYFNIHADPLARGGLVRGPMVRQ